ncbi:hypothetical protein J5Y04_07145 [Kitasatospora sp. RG8]|uniref:hypothetical protein n=1 Tax=Kitasatospora sp. RG8 TaxID=2820815 RepID=UPI001ADF7A3E|nr:hypothetical protein [Kitasatospora sp. RG8]MBP0449326.1 hypothetical protein [Kitasatospora sp. RG8]
MKLSSEARREKRHHAQSAGLELLAATGDVFKALELIEHGDGPGTAAVYVASADKRLRQAGGLLGEVAVLLGSGTLAPETVTWYQDLDYERLYESGVASGRVPRNRECWSELVAPTTAGGPLAVCHDYRGRVLRTAALMTEWLQAAPYPGAETALRRVQSAMVDLAVYAQLMGYFNDVEPLDERWLRRTAAAVAAG